MTRKVVLAAAGFGILCVAAAALLPMLMMASVLGMGASASAAGALTDCSVEDTGVTVSELDQEQVKSARTIVAVGKSLDVPARGWVIAIAAAMQESGLRNLQYGDRDSQGLFQQRPSAGWGTPTDVTNPSYAAHAFYGGPGSPTNNAGLLDIPGWKSMSLWEAAQRVQRSAFPMAYARHESAASRVVEQLSGTTGECAPLQSGPWLLPVSVNYALTSGFGMRVSPTRGSPDFHTGQDFAVPSGTPALAVTSGAVVFTGRDGGYGNLVRLRHANGVESWYAHLSRILVNVGDEVDRGTVIARTGSTGNSTGAHLHLEIRVRGNPTDPIPWFRAKGLDP